MEFHNTTLGEIAEKEVSVHLLRKNGTDTCDECQTFLNGGVLQIDFIPKFSRTHTAPVPGDALIMKDQSGKFAIVIRPETVAGRLLQRLWKEQLRQIAEDN